LAEKPARELLRMELIKKPMQRLKRSNPNAGLVNAATPK